MSAPAALWVLFRRKPVLDAAAVAGALGPDVLVEGGEGLLSVRLREHPLRIVSLGVPLPAEILEQCLPAAHLRPDQKVQLTSHLAHALVLYEGGPPGADGFVTLYEAAWALEDEAMLGVINPVTWMCLTRDMFAQTMEKDFVDAVRASPAESLGLWLGFVKMFKPDGATWLVTRGGWMVGLPDLAWLATDLAETERIATMFAGILDYATASGTQLRIGDAIDFGDRALRIRAPYEYVEQLGEATLVLEARES